MRSVAGSRQSGSGGDLRLVPIGDVAIDVQALPRQGAPGPGIEVLGCHRGPVGCLLDLGPPDAAAELDEFVAGGAAFAVVGGECLVPRVVFPTSALEGKASWSAFVAPLAVWGRVMVPASPISSTRPDT